VALGGLVGPHRVGHTGAADEVDGRGAAASHASDRIDIGYAPGGPRAAAQVRADRRRRRAPRSRARDGSGPM